MRICTNSHTQAEGERAHLCLKWGCNNTHTHTHRRVISKRANWWLRQTKSIGWDSKLNHIYLVCSQVSFIVNSKSKHGNMDSPSWWPDYFCHIILADWASSFSVTLFLFIRAYINNISKDSNSKLSFILSVIAFMEVLLPKVPMWTSKGKCSL